MINLPPDAPPDGDRQASTDLALSAMGNVPKTVADLMRLANDEARSGCFDGDKMLAARDFLRGLVALLRKSVPECFEEGDASGTEEAN